MLKLTLLMLMLYNFIIILMNKQPIKIIINIISLLLLITLMIYNSLNNPWFSYVMIMIIISGLLIIFLYMANNTPNMPKNKSIIKMLPMVIFLTTMLYYMLNNNIMNYMINSSFNNTNYSTVNIMMMFSKNYMFLSLTMFLYLILSMIMSTKITKNEMKPIRLM